MRTTFDFVGMIVFALGVFATIGGCVIADVSAAAGSFLFWGGVIMILFGWCISSVASHKKCPACAEQVKAKALKCKHCGYDFKTAQPPTSFSEPFYK